MSTVFDFLKNDFTNLYMKNVLEHKAVNKAIAFCDNDNLNLIYTGMFSEVNNGKGITDDLELYLVSYLIQKNKKGRRNTRPINRPHNLCKNSNQKIDLNPSKFISLLIF